MKRYKVSLKNHNEDLDLRGKINEITESLGHFIAHDNKRSFKTIHDISIVLPVCKTYIIVDVNEDDKEWHPELGKRLKRNHGMSKFCLQNSSGKDEMFDCIEEIN